MFVRSRSVRTSTLLQYWQTVCTLLDHWKTIFAPQLGQVAAGCVIAMASRKRVGRILDYSLAARAPGSAYERCNLRTTTSFAPNLFFNCASKSHSARGTQQ